MMDERQGQIYAKAMGVILALIYVGLFISAFWKLFVTKDITNSTLEIFLIVAIPVLFLILARKDESLMIPRRFLGEPIPTDDVDESKQYRKQRYVNGAIGLAASYTLLNIILYFTLGESMTTMIFFQILNGHNSLNLVLNFAIDFILGFVIFYAVGALLDEIIIKRYHQKLAALEHNDE